MIDNVQYLLYDFKTSLSKQELQNYLKLMQKTCTNAEELSISLYYIYYIKVYFTDSI